MEKKKTNKPVKVEKPKTVILTTDFCNLYVKVRNGQILKPVRGLFTLYHKLGHLYKIKDSYSISSTGYRILNKVASVSLATPEKVIVDGRDQPNPYIERNKETKIIEHVWIRKVGIGYSLAGNIVAIDKTLCYNIKTYFLQSIQAKMKKVEWKNGKATDKLLHPNCAKLGVEDKEPKDEGEWAFFKVEPPLGIWVNYSDPAILDCVEEHTQRQRFADRIAQTIVERNILKDHPAISVSTVEPKQKNGLVVAHVPVYGFRHELEAPNIKEILAQLEKGEETVEVQAEVIDEVPVEEEKEAIKDTAESDKEEAPKEEKPEEKREKNKKTPAEMTEPSEDPNWNPEKEAQK
jgi:hypothetical protein